MKIIRDKRRQTVSYDKNLLDGIDYVDMKTAIMFMRSAISGDVYDRTSPYSCIRKLVLFFDEENGVMRHGRAGSREVVRFVDSHPKMRKAKNFLRYTDNELINLLYEQTMYKGFELLEKVVWKLMDVRKHLNDFLTEIEGTDLFSRYATTEAIRGSDNGRQLGLKDLCKRARKSMSELTEFVAKLDRIISKGKDPLSYH